MSISLRTALVAQSEFIELNKLKSIVNLGYFLINSEKELCLTYTENSDLGKWLKHFFGLPFLPFQDIQNAFGEFNLSRFKYWMFVFWLHFKYIRGEWLFISTGNSGTRAI